VGIDTSGFAFPKGALRVEVKREKRLTLGELERRARVAVRLRDGFKCVVPGCKDEGIHLHHIVYRSRSKALKWAVHNLCYLCVAHHDLEHAGKITIHPRTAEGELIVTGEKKYLAFRL
jgi:5-methylcytosine-specific restriction endonuclease McrA